MLDIFNWIKILTTEIQFKILESKWRRWETMTKLTWPKVVLMQKGGNLEEIKVIAGKNNMTARTGREVTQQSKELCCQRKLWKETLGKLPYFAVTIIWDFRINWKPKIQGVLLFFHYYVSTNTVAMLMDGRVENIIELSCAWWKSSGPRNLMSQCTREGKCRYEDGYASLFLME